MEYTKFKIINDYITEAFVLYKKCNIIENDSIPDPLHYLHYQTVYIHHYNNNKYKINDYDEIVYYEYLLDTFADGFGYFFELFCNI